MFNYKPIVLAISCLLIITAAGCVRGAGKQSETNEGIKFLQKAFPTASEAPADKVVFIVSGDLYVASADGIEILETGRVYVAAWSPDGTSLLVTRLRPYSTYDLVIVNGDDRSTWEYVQEDILGSAYPAADWSPDGSRIVYAGAPPTETAPSGVYITDKDGTTTPQLAADCSTWECCRPIWSPDGTLIAFIEKSGVEIVEPDNPDSRRLVYTFSVKNSDCYAKNISWFPDSRRLLISDRLKIKVLDLADDSTTTLFEVDSPDAKGLVWAIVLPDGVHIAYQAYYRDEARAHDDPARYHREIMLTEMDSMTWRDITPNFDEELGLFFDWWQAPETIPR
jgi:hypothetical protein